jgi:hypothetical protein
LVDQSDATGVKPMLPDPPSLVLAMRRCMASLAAGIAGANFVAADAPLADLVVIAHREGVLPERLLISFKAALNQLGPVQQESAQHREDLTTALVSRLIVVYFAEPRSDVDSGRERFEST